MELTRKHITWGGGVAIVAGLSTLIAFGRDIGLPFPLTKHSETIQTIQEFSEDRYLEQQIMRADQRHYRNQQLSGYIARDRLLHSQFEGRTNLTLVERQIKASLETTIEDYLREQEKLAKADD